MGRCTVCGRLPGEGCAEWCDRVRAELQVGIRTDLSGDTCGRGHAWTRENEYITPEGARRCRACKRARAKARRLKRRERLEAAT